MGVERAALTSFSVSSFFFFFSYFWPGACAHISTHT